MNRIIDQNTINFKTLDKLQLTKEKINTRDVIRGIRDHWDELQPILSVSSSKIRSGNQ